MWTERGFQWCPRPLHPPIHSQPRSGLYAFYVLLILPNFQLWWSSSKQLFAKFYKSFCKRWLLQSFSSLSSSFRSPGTVWSSQPLDPRSLSDGFTTTCFSYRSSIPFHPIWFQSISLPSHSIPFGSILCISLPSLPFHFVPFHSVQFPASTILSAGGCVRHCGDRPQHQLEHSLPPHSGTSLSLSRQKKHN